MYSQKTTLTMLGNVFAHEVADDLGRILVVGSTSSFEGVTKIDRALEVNRFFLRSSGTDRGIGLGGHSMAPRKYSASIYLIFTL